MFSGYMFLSKNRKDKSIIYLTLLILTISFNNFQQWLFSKNYLFEGTSIVEYIHIPWHFLLFPLFYTFLIHYLNIAEKSVNILKITFPLFCIAIIIQIVFLIYFNTKTDVIQLDFFYNIYAHIEEIISFIISIGIFTYSYNLVYKKEKLFPTIVKFDNLKWLRGFFTFILLGCALWITALVLTAIVQYKNFIPYYYPLRIYMTIATYWLAYEGFRQIRLLKERQQIRKYLTPEGVVFNSLVMRDETNEEEHKKDDSTNNEIKYYEQFLQIDLFIKQKKKYLQSKYTLQSLSEDLELSPSTLSSIINTYSNKSFIDYINEMRVEQAKVLLLDPKYSDYTITSIGLESGFNSKSTFYNVFKKHTDCTPIAYKNSCCS